MGREIAIAIAAIATTDDANASARETPTARGESRVRSPRAPHSPPRFMDLAPDVIAALAETLADDVLSGNYELARPQTIRFVSSVTFFGRTSASGALLGALARALFFALALACAAVALAFARRSVVLARVDAWARERALRELGTRTTAACALREIRVRWNAVTLRGLEIGNARADGVEFTSPYLASFEEIRISCDFFSALGRLQFGNFIAGFVVTRCDSVYVRGASVFVEEVGKAKNFKIMRGSEGEKAVAAAVEAKEEKREEKREDGFFGGISSSLAATQRAIDAQMQEAMKLPGAVAGTLKNAGADVTRRLYALAEILENLKRASPIDREEAKHLDRRALRRAPTVLRVHKLTFDDWSLTIASVASTPFQFKRFEKTNFLGTPLSLAKEVGIGLVTEIMNDFHRKMFGGITDGVTTVGSTIIGAGSTVLGAGSTIIGGVGSTVIGAGSTIIGGVATGVTSVGTSIGRGFSSQ